MKILLTGGGTGGHITPILAVAHELKRQNPEVKVIYVGERGGKFAELTADHEAIDEVYTIFAGKFRRYHGESWLSRLLDIKTNLLNIRDVFYVLFGAIESWFLLGKICPDSILLKGGFVGVPMGIAAAARKLPFITHDSDSMPGLANRLVSRWAVVHATALPPEEYSYPKSKVRQVGVLVEPHFHPVTKEEQGSYKQQIGVPADKPMLLVTGSSSGAQRLNEAVVKIVDTLLHDYPDLSVVHQVGKGKGGVYGNYRHERLTVLDFMRPMYLYTGAADLVVARASGSTVAELGTQGKPVIVVASPFLAGGHQLKNAEILEHAGAVISVKETGEKTDEQQLDQAIRSLLSDASRREALAKRLSETTLRGAAENLAGILLGTARKH